MNLDPTVKALCASLHVSVCQAVGDWSVLSSFCATGWNSNSQHAPWKSLMSSFSIQRRASSLSKSGQRERVRVQIRLWRHYGRYSRNTHVFPLCPPWGPVMWIQAWSSQHDSLACYVRSSNNPVHQPKYVMRVSSSDSLSCVSGSCSVPPQTMFHSAWQIWPASCQSAGPKSFRQSTSLVTHTRTQNPSCDSRQRDSHDRQDCGH